MRWTILLHVNMRKQGLAALEDAGRLHVNMRERGLAALEDVGRLQPYMLVASRVTRAERTI